MSNKNKNLLNENTVRRFMKLAALQPISSGFIKETFQEEIEEAEDNNEAENLEENETENLEEMGGAYGAREDMPPEDEAAEEEAEVPEVPEEEPAGEAPGMEQFAKDVAQALADAIESASNGTVSMSVEGDGEEPALEEPEGEEEPAPEMDMEMSTGEEEEEEEMMQEEAAEDESLEEEFEISSATQDEIVQEVYNRIAKKILKATINK